MVNDTVIAVARRQITMKLKESKQIFMNLNHTQTTTPHRISALRPWMEVRIGPSRRSRRWSTMSATVVSSSWREGPELGREADR